ncbi:HlyD family efflux transporter periplasmic adaptor subunit [Actinoplanes sp. RD1]|uniref:HlyD family efflux transporter periplasmic adaptor subunit n=1 Tax=Actinoplanes sp. RD1 TaxID=3064538 RepID=UPI002740A969|nr:HlyD family efflux transporter periplasmic adaptor subunit [Actinoplanes sp. RD1]
MAGPTVTDSASTPDTAPPPPPPPRRRGTMRKWRARLIVLLMLAAAVVVFIRLTADRRTDAALIDLGTVTLTAQPIPVETPRPGQITQVSVKPEQQVKAGATLGTLEVTTTDSDGEPVLRKLTLVAPRAGIVVDEPATMGSTLQPGQPFVQLYDPAELLFVTDIPVEDLPEISPGMEATLEAKNLDRTIKAAVERVVPRVAGAAESGAQAGYLRMMLRPTTPAEVSGLVPGMRFTGSVDTRTGPPHPRLVALPPT